MPNPTYKSVLTDARVAEIFDWGRYADVDIPPGDLNDAYSCASSDLGLGKTPIVNPPHMHLLVGVQEYGHGSIVLFEVNQRIESTRCAYLVEEPFSQTVADLAADGYSLVEINPTKGSDPQATLPRMALNRFPNPTPDVA